MTIGQYPEHEKQSHVEDQSQVCDEFIEWLETKGIVLCEFDEETDRLWPTHRSTTTLVAEFFNIDLEKIADERKQILAALRELNT